MKSLLAIWTALVLLLTACPAAAGADSAVDALIEQLDAYLSVQEQLIGAQADALQRVSDFCGQRSYASLLGARMASDQARQTVSALTAPALLLPDEAFAALMDMGVETDALEAELQTLAENIIYGSDSMLRYEVLLESVLLHRGQVDTLAQWAALDRQHATLSAQYICTMINYLLLPVAEDAQVGAFWASIPQRYPELGSARLDWETEDVTLVTRAMKVFDSYEELNSQAASLLGQDTYSSDQLSRSLQGGELDALKANVLVIDGMPAMVPLPVDWLYPENTLLSASDEVSEACDALPKVITVWDSGVSLDAWSRYIDQLLDFGAELYAKEGSDAEGWSCTLTFSGSPLIVQWFPDGRAVVGYRPDQLSLETCAYILCCR